MVRVVPDTFLPELGRRRWVLLVGAVVLLALAAWAVLSMMQARRAADQLGADLDITAGHARALNIAAVGVDLPALEVSSRNLQSAVSGPVWTVMSHAPVVGSTVRSVRDLSDAAVSASAAAQQLAPVLPRFDGERLRDASGRIDTRALVELAAALELAAVDLDEAASRAETADTGAIGGVGDTVAMAREQLIGLPDQVRGAAKAARVTAQLLGHSGRQRWAILVQNGAEARGTGGFLGAYALLTADSGRLHVGEIDTNDTLLSTPIPNRRMPRPFLDLWGDSDTAEWNSYNLSRHFPYTGELTHAGMARRGTDVDHVLAIDAHTVSALLAGTGPITASGVTVDAASAVRFFNVDVYNRFPNVAEKDAVVVELMRQLMDRVTAGEFDVETALRALAPMIDEGRMYVWSAKEPVQQRLEQWAVGGTVPEDPGPWVGVALNNSAGNKMDAFVSSSVTYRANTCGTGLSMVTVSLTNNAPQNGSDYAFSRRYMPDQPEGSTRMLVDVYGPMAAEWRSSRIDGMTEYVTEGKERGHPVWIYDLYVERGETTSLVVEFKERPSPQEPLVSAQPMAVPQSVAAERACS